MRMRPVPRSTLRVTARYSQPGGVPGGPMPPQGPPQSRANSQLGASASGNARPFAPPPPSSAPPPPPVYRQAAPPQAPYQQMPPQRMQQPQPAYPPPPPAPQAGYGAPPAQSSYRVPMPATSYDPPQAPPMAPQQPYAARPSPAPAPSPLSTSRTLQPSAPTTPQPDPNGCLCRSELARKEVITRTTGTKLGSVVDLWVDTARWEVIALDLAPPLDAVVETVKRSLFPDGLYGSIVLLSSLRQVGDVILVHDENAIERQFSPLALTTLVKLEVQTESGSVLGRVRDFLFDPDSGRVASILYDRLGSTVLPRQTFNVFSVPITEVLAAGPERIIVRESAAQTATLVNKGFIDGYFLPSAEFVEYEQQGAAYAAQDEAAYYYAQQQAQQMYAAQRQQQQQQYAPPPSRSYYPEPTPYQAGYRTPQQPQAPPPQSAAPPLPPQAPAALPPPQTTRSFDDFIAPGTSMREVEMEGMGRAPVRGRSVNRVPPESSRERRSDV